MNKAFLTQLKKTHPNVKIVMASKYLETFESFNPFLEAKHYVFGENRAHVLLEKRKWLADYPIEWHYIGTLQTKKVKSVIDDIDVLHALDRLKLAKEIEKRRTGILPCFIQVNISEEPQKHGLKIDAVEAFADAVANFKHLKIIGLMGMAEETDNVTQIRRQFRSLRQLRDTLKKRHPAIEHLSMGMTQDYHIALEEGATVLRLGRILLSEGSYGTK